MSIERVILKPPPVIIDAHEDIAFNILCAGRDYRRSAHETRALEVSRPDLRAGLGLATLGLPEWIAGRVGVIFATIFTEPARSKFTGDEFCPKYSTPAEARAIALRQLDVYRALTSDAKAFRLITTV